MAALTKPPRQDEIDAILRKDFLAFAEKGFKTLHPGQAFKPNWHIEAIAYRLDQAGRGNEKRLVVNVPPRSLKSELASIMLPAFVLGHNPTERIVCVSYSHTLSTLFSREFGRIVEADWYRRIFPATRFSKVTEEMIETTEGGARFATSIGGSVTGLGGNYIIIDDPMKPNEAPSEAAREGVIRYFRDTLSTRLDDKLAGVIIVVMQRLHQDDLSGHLLRSGGWSHLSLPAIAVDDESIPLGPSRTHDRKNGDVLHPDREPQALLEEARRNLGTAMFAAQYQQDPMPAEGNIIKRGSIKPFTLPIALNGRLTQSWDTALKGNPGRDYSVCTTWREVDNRHYLVDVCRERLEFPDLVNKAVALYRKHHPDALLIEDQGSGTSLIQDLRTRYSIHSIGRRPKVDKETRLATVAPMFDAGQVFIPMEEPWSADLIKELCGYPSVRHDDQVDSVTQYLMWRRASEGAFSYEFLGPWDEPGAPCGEDLLYRLAGW